LEPPLKLRGLWSPELPESPPEVLPREKPWTDDPSLPVLRLETDPSMGRATVRLPDERDVEELSSDERLLELLNVFPLNAAPLLLLPDERVERSELGTWFDWLLRELTLRDESLLDDERDCPEELLDDVLRDDDPLLPLLPPLLDERPPWSDRSFFLSSLSRAMAKLAVRKTDRRPNVTTQLRTRLRRIWGTFLSGRLIPSPTLP
jgi:hypothetical protein